MRLVRYGGHSINAACIDERRHLRDLEPMRILPDAIEGALHDLPEQALAALIGKKLAAQGVTLSAGSVEGRIHRLLLASQMCELSQESRLSVTHSRKLADAVQQLERGDTVGRIHRVEMIGVDRPRVYKHGPVPIESEIDVGQLAE